MDAEQFRKLDERLAVLAEHTGLAMDAVNRLPRVQRDGNDPLGAPDEGER